MRKVHYKVVLDVFTVEDENVNGVDIVGCLDFWPEYDGNLVTIQDVTVESIKITDSR